MTTPRRWFVVSAIWAAALIGTAAQSPAPPTPRSVIDQYCITCHNARLKTAGLMLDRLDVNRVANDAAAWEKVVGKLRTREMPPAGSAHPDAATYAAVIASIENAIDDAAAAKPDPGRIPVHRLNRTEYTNAVRDLLALEVDGKSLLWSDEPDQEGFDNVASVLSVSPALLEGYLSAARRISTLAVGDEATAPVLDTFEIPRSLVQDDRMSDDLPFGSQGGALVHYQFPRDGEYEIKVRLKRQLYGYILAMGEPMQIDIRIDRALVRRFTIGGEAKGLPSPESWVGDTTGDPEFEDYMHTADAGLDVRVPVDAGAHDVGISFVRRFREAEGIPQPPARPSARTVNESYHDYPGIETLVIRGPYRSSRSGADSPSRRRIFVCRPTDAASEEPCARRILSTLARRAYRHPATAPEADTLLTFYRQGRTTGSFDAGIRRGLERILAAPSFLFRVEREPANAASGSVYRLDDFDLASRLSFFLWSSVPDDAMLRDAEAGRLGEPAVLEAQVRRMLADPRATSLVRNFASQWLQLGKLKTIVPDPDAYSEFDENLRDAMRRETETFIEQQLREDRSVLDLLTANYSYLNERLARHYGVPDVYGVHLRKVTFADDRRGGLLGQASVLSLTSYPNRTSVVLRGRWLLSTLLGSPPPPPPENVPPLKEAGEDGVPRSLRGRMAVHRDNPVCASCHQRMDPLGFALENFDALGKWRAAADGVTVDASASLPDGAVRRHRRPPLAHRQPARRLRPHAQRKDAGLCHRPRRRVHGPSRRAGDRARDHGGPRQVVVVDPGGCPEHAVHHGYRTVLRSLTCT